MTRKVHPNEMGPITAVALAAIGSQAMVDQFRGKPDGDYLRPGAEGNKIVTRSVASEIVPRFVSADRWAALPVHRNTVVEYDDPTAKGDEVRDVGIEEQTYVRRFRVVQFLCSLVTSPEPREGDITKFGKVIARLVADGLVLGRLAEPVSVTLNGGRCVLLAMFAVDLTREQLNEHLGFEGFVREGDVPTQPWP